jgi:hypothetical protein
MLTEKRKILIQKKHYMLTYQIFTKKDKKMLRDIFNEWLKLNKLLKFNGASRMVNIPELLTEGLFCIEMNAVRKIKATAAKGVKVSFDTVNLNSGKLQQIKASSSKGPTSFGPKPCWDTDQLFFMDFFKKNVVDGKYNIYQIPSKLISKLQVNKKQTLRAQQGEKRRPRIELRQILKDNNIKPIKSCSVF